MRSRYSRGVTGTCACRRLAKNVRNMETNSSSLQATYANVFRKPNAFAEVDKAEARPHERPAEAGRIRRDYMILRRKTTAARTADQFAEVPARRPATHRVVHLRSRKAPSISQTFPEGFSGPTPPAAWANSARRAGDALRHTAGAARVDIAIGCVRLQPVVRQFTCAYPGAEAMFAHASSGSHPSCQSGAVRSL